ncbi:hypothetical protein U1Q18_039868 [Sarracenia purpurea var. burkii]
MPSEPGPIFFIGENLQTSDEEISVGVLPAGIRNDHLLSCVLDQQDSLQVAPGFHCEIRNHITGNRCILRRVLADGSRLLRRKGPVPLLAIL